MPVTVLFVLITVATIVANAGAAAADLTQADFALANPVRVGVPGTWLPALGTLKIAGAAGLLLGLLGVRDIGITAAAGLVRFLLGATGVQLLAASTATSSPRPLLPAGRSVAGAFRRTLRDRAAALRPLAVPGAVQTLVTAQL
jgi:DoxX-like family